MASYDAVATVKPYTQMQPVPYFPIILDGVFGDGSVFPPGGGPGNGGSGGGNSSGNGSEGWIDETKDPFNRNERAIAEYLRDKGWGVESLPRSNSTSSPDARLYPTGQRDGLSFISDFKTIEGTSPNTPVNVVDKAYHQNAVFAVVDLRSAKSEWTEEMLDVVFDRLNGKSFPKNFRGAMFIGNNFDVTRVHSS